MVDLARNGLISTQDRHWSPLGENPFQFLSRGFRQPALSPGEEHWSSTKAQRRTGERVGVVVPARQDRPWGALVAEDLLGGSDRLLDRFGLVLVVGDSHDARGVSHR